MATGLTVRGLTGPSFFYDEAKKVVYILSLLA